jgi:MFS family permease
VNVETETPGLDRRPASALPGSALSRARGWLAVAGLLAGIAAFGAGEAVYELIPAKKVQQKIMGQTVVAPTPETSGVASTQNAALTFGLLGVCLGGLVGAAGGLARRSTIAMLGAGVFGSLIGSAMAALLSFAMLPVISHLQPYHPEYELAFSMLSHGLIWGLIGAAAGLAFGVGLGGWRLVLGGLVAGFAGALLGSIVFDLIGAALFPLANTGEPISTTWPSRLVARIAVTVGCAAIVILSLPRDLRAGAAQSSEVSVQPLS